MITVTFIALSPISHGAFSDGSSAGNAMQFRREPILGSSGTKRVPVVSGNALRGIMRRNIMREALSQSGVTRELFDEALPGKAGRAWDRLYAAMCQGGTIEEMERVVSPECIRALRAAIPPLSLFGSALYSSLLAGMMSVGFAYPICAETVAAGLVSNIGNAALVSSEELVSDTGLVRHVDREQADTQVSGVGPMPYTVEVLQIGVKLQARIRVQPHATEIELACLAHAIKSLVAIGGKTSVGFGTVAVHTDPEMDDSLYIEWLAQKEKNGAAFVTLAEQLA